MVGSWLVPSVREVRVGSGALVGDLGHVASVGVGVVLDVLNPAVGESHGVGADHHALLVLALVLLELGAAVGVADPVLVGVGSVGAVIGGGVVRVGLHLE